MPAHWQSLFGAAHVFQGCNENDSPCQNNEKRDVLGVALNMGEKIPHFSQSIDQAASISTDPRCQPGLQSFWEGLNPGVERAPFVINENQADQNGTTAQTFGLAGVTTCNVEPTVRACSAYSDFDTSNDWAASGDFELFDDFDLFGESEAHWFGGESTTGWEHSDVGCDIAAGSALGSERLTLDSSSTASSNAELNMSVGPGEPELSGVPDDTLWNELGSFTISSPMLIRARDNSVDPEPVETPDIPWTPQAYVSPTVSPNWNVKELDAYDCNADEACDMRSTRDFQLDSEFQNEDEQLLKKQHKAQILDELKALAIQKFSKFRKRARDKMTLRVKMLKKRLDQQVRDRLGIPLYYALYDYSKRILLNQSDSGGRSVAVCFHLDKRMLERILMSSTVYAGPRIARNSVNAMLSHSSARYNREPTDWRKLLFANH